jgi:23S rRNA (adenine2503-C2)-methyltransferase
VSAVEVKNLFNFTLPALTAEMVGLGESKFRSKQLFAWIYQKHVLDFDQMSDISKNFRAILKRDYCLTLPTVFKRQDSDDGTVKLFWRWKTGPKSRRSSCATTMATSSASAAKSAARWAALSAPRASLKKERGLTAAEMTGEVIVMNQLLAKEGENVSHIVVMGTGEPFR